MKTKLVFIINQPLNISNSKLLEVNYKSKRIYIEFWCITPLYNKVVYKKYISKNYRPINKKNFIYIKEYKQLFKLISNLKDKKTIAINDCRSLTSYFIQYLMIKNGSVKLSILKSYNFGVPRFNLKKIKMLFKFGLKRMLIKILNRAIYMPKLILIKFFRLKPKFYLVANQFSENTLKKNNCFNILKYNSNSYSYFKKNYLEKKRTKDQYFVYIDQEFERSFESQLTKNNHNFIKKEKHWECLNSIFDKINLEYPKNEIKIAAHYRRSDKNLAKTKRKFYFDQTASLIKRAKLVIGHASFAMDYAILFRKPIIFINFNSLDSIQSHNTSLIQNLNMVRVTFNSTTKLKKNFFG